MSFPYAVVDVIPHAKPMSLLDKIVSYDGAELVAGLTIREDSIFFNGSAVPAWVGIEYMGQAVAAFAGVGARVDNKPIKIGFLVSSRRYISDCSSFPLGAYLSIRAKPITDNETGLRVFDCSITGENINVTTNLNVFIPDDVDNFLEREG